jgi:hypothetical protein
MVLNPIDILRKGVLAYIGAIAMTSDQVVKTLDQFTKRGAQARKRAGKGAKKGELAAPRQVERAIGRPGDDIEESVAATKALDNARNRLPGALNQSAHADVLELNSEIARLDDESDDAGNKTDQQESEVATRLLPDYEKLNAKAVIDRLPTLEEPDLLALRVYEPGHANRITVLRAIERELISRQAARGELVRLATSTAVEPLPRYDELTAEEIVERLPRLNKPELLHVKVYEQEHSNRVTILRAVDERLAAKAEDNAPL